MNSGKVVLVAKVHPVLLEALTAKGYTVMQLDNADKSDLLTALKTCVGIITSNSLIIDKNVIDAAPELQWIGRLGSGMEIIDVSYAMAKGIVCFSSPEGNANAVAEHTLGLLLGVSKNIHKSANEVTGGIWEREQNRGFELEGKTIGIIGYGHTGSAFARKLAGFDVQVLAYDIHRKAKHPVPPYVTICDTLERIYQEAEVVSFHVPLNQDTHYYYDDGFQLNMKYPHVLLNTSRGPVVDVAALLQGLDSGKIRGAGIDVWEEEPVSKMSKATKAALDKALQHPGVIITPHIGGYSHEALFKMSRALADKLT